MAATYVPPSFEPIKGLNIRELSDPRVVERIRVLDSYCLAVKYTDNYYETYVKNGLHCYNQMAYYYDILVGSITCRLETTDEENVYRLYIMTIAVLEPYRHMGIGTRLLHTILTNVMKDEKVRIGAVVLHMQVGSPVMDFYKKNGFETVETVKDYYSDLDVCDAYLMKRAIPQPHIKASKK